MADGTIQRLQLVLRDVIYRRLPEYLAEKPGVPLEVVASVMQHLRGLQDSSEDGQRLADGFLEYMQSGSAGGERAENPTVTQSEYERWQKPDLVTGEATLMIARPRGKKQGRNSWVKDVSIVGTGAVSKILILAYRRKSPAVQESHVGVAGGPNLVFEGR